VKRIYGSTPLHLLAHLASLALAGWAILQITDARAPWQIFFWLIGSVLLHDALLWPFYTILDQITQGLTIAGDRGRVLAINHLRIPAGLSALMFIAAFPAILELKEGNFTRVSGLGYEGYLGRWLLVSGLLFAGSAVLYAVRVRRVAAVARPAQ